MTELKDHVIIQQEGEDHIYTEEDILNIPTAEKEVDADQLVVETQVKIIDFFTSGVRRDDDTSSYF